MPGKDKSASDLVREIRQETARRKRIWRKMEAAARDAVKAVKAHARSLGITDTKWFGFKLTDGKGGDVARISYYHPDGPERGALSSQDVRRSGVLVRWGMINETYEGYPSLTDKDPGAFKKAAVEYLMGNLNEYIDFRDFTQRNK